MKYCVFDVEADGLLHEVTKIYCFSYKIFDDGKYITRNTLTSYEEIVSFIESFEGTFVGHNIIIYDIPLLKQMLDVEITQPIIDTLGLSYYLYPMMKKHGLEVWGLLTKILKVKIKDWKDLPLEEYILRCETDVDINSNIFIHFIKKLIGLYGNIGSSMPIIEYFNFKLECLRDQEEGIPVNIELCEEHLRTLLPIFDEKTRLLSEAMPEEVGKLIKRRPKKMFKKDSTITEYGLKWIRLLSQKQLPMTTEAVYEAPNPGSSDQIKQWLFSFGWKPITFKDSTKKDSDEKVPQINLPFGGGICPSIQDMYEDHPILEELEGYFMLRHRINIFKGYIDTCRDGKVISGANGFTKTHRLQHRKPVVNLPKPGIFFGKECREVLEIPGDEYLMVGSDISGLEDNTKQHYIYFHDPEYVDEMRVPGFDSHIDIGVLSKLITREEELFYREVERKKDSKEDISEEDLDRFKIISKKRSTSKGVNFSATYGAYPPKIAETGKMSLEDAEFMFEVYWERNWAVKVVAEQATVKVINGQRWLLNPISGFWLYLSSDKDRFSALNQNTGVFVFDTWYSEMRKRLLPLGIKILLQYHDEVMFIFKKELKDQVESIIYDSMEEVNNILKLNVKIEVSVDFGSNYAEVH